jgi:pimeloyl-ACP methyl ester carboxylesterase
VTGQKVELLQSTGWLSILFGALLGFIVTALACAGLLSSYSPSGWLQVGSLALLAIGLATQRRRRPVLLSALALFVGVALVRLIAIDRGNTRMITLPAGHSSRWLGRILDEQDGSLVGAQILRRLWHIKGFDRDRLVPSMHDAYVDMRRDEGLTATPAFDTLLKRQSPAAFDALLIEPKKPARAGLIFLHGYAGSYTIECWLLAEAARAIDAVTVCPATDFSGHWAQRDGEKTARETIDFLHARGVRRIYLAGLSNGGIGAVALANRLGNSIAGLVAISGAGPGGNAGLPTLVIQGSQDSMMPPSSARDFADRVHASYAEFEAGHFVLLTKRPEARAAISRWLALQEQKNP